MQLYKNEAAVINFEVIREEARVQKDVTEGRNLSPSLFKLCVQEQLTKSMNNALDVY